MFVRYIKISPLTVSSFTMRSVMGGKLELLFDLLYPLVLQPSRSFANYGIYSRGHRFDSGEITVPTSSSNRIWCELLRDIPKLTLLKYAK